jgi:hypothetical protein
VLFRSDLKSDGRIRFVRSRFEAAPLCPHCKYALVDIEGYIYKDVSGADSMIGLRCSNCRELLHLERISKS